MSFLQANCPSCAAPIEFKSGSSIVIVCPFCRSAVARTDRALEDLGKVAEIMQSESPLRVGLHGMWNNQRFELTGRAQLRHQLGGFWDEWYATFGNGWVGWLAEAQGKFYLTFYQPLPQDAQLPSFTDLQLGQSLPQIPNPSGTPLMVAEKGVATSVAAEGEIPYKLVPNEQSEYADLAGKNRAFGTIDYGMNPPFVFVGQELTLAELGWADLKPAERQAPRVSAAGMGCPNCGGPINLQVPDKAERVTCPNCDSLLDCSTGKLSWMKSLAPSPDAHKFDLQIGAEGTFNEKKMRIIGAVVRSVTVDGIKYFWHEYLLYNPAVGFRWLVHSDNHWNFVEPLNVADVTGGGNTAQYDGKTYKLFQDANAVVEYVKGEFYWRVEQGETVRAIDYVCPPYVISNEMTGNEMNWSKGTYTRIPDIEKAFGVADLPQPWNVAPNQPFEGSFWYTWGLLFLVALIGIWIVMIPLKMESSALPPTQIMLPPLPAEKGSNPVFTQPFELKPRSNVEITITAPVSNSWASFDVDFVNEANDEVEQVPLDIEFYSGVEDGESWSEGSTTQSTSFSSIQGGKYRLKIDGQWQNWQQPLPVTVSVKQNTSSWNFCCAFIFLIIGPIFGIVRKWLFESSRWSQSMFTSSGDVNTGSDSSDSCSSCSSCSS